VCLHSVYLTSLEVVKAWEQGYILPITGPIASMLAKGILTAQ